jgi:hypothetical protein
MGVKRGKMWLKQTVLESRGTYKKAQLRVAPFSINNAVGFRFLLQ